MAFQPMLELWRQAWQSFGVFLLAAGLGSSLQVKPLAASDITNAEEIVQALTHEASMTPTKPQVRTRGIQPRSNRIDLTVHFATDSAVIEPQSIDQIREIARATKQLDLKRFALLILGHTDSRGSHEYNKALSERRARAVKQALVSKYGLSEASLVAEGRGESELLISPEEEPRDFAQNRRVELRLVARER